MKFTKKTKTIAAFTLVELMVALGIYIIMAGLIFANQDKFNQSLAFSNLGYDIALTIRQAQTYGYAVRGEGSNGSTFTNAFGVHFASDKPSSFTVFYEPIQKPLASASQAAPLSYEACQSSTSCDSGLQTVSNYNLQNNYTISNLCYGPGSGCGSTDSTCSSVSVGNSTNNYLDIVFQRPNINAFIFNNSTNYPILNYPLSEAAVELQSPAGEKECVSVFSSGDIEVSTTTAATPS